MPTARYRKEHSIEGNLRSVGEVRTKELSQMPPPKAELHSGGKSTNLYAYYDLQMIFTENLKVTGILHLLFLGG